MARFAAADWTELGDVVMDVAVAAPKHENNVFSVNTQHGQSNHGYRCQAASAYLAMARTYDMKEALLDRELI